jgi:hypothetical protein
MIRGLIFNWGPWLINKTLSIFTRGQNLIKAIYKELAVKKQIFFIKNNQIPLSSEIFSEVTGVRWRCSLDPVIFIDPVYLTLKEQHLPYLGLTVKIPGEQDLDLSSWINDIRYIGSKEPSLSDIFIVWCYQHGVSYFHCLDQIIVEIIDEMGDTIVKGLNE